MARRSHSYKSGYKRTSYRSTYNSGSEAARRHIREAAEFSKELGGTDEDVKAYFFSLTPAELSDLLKEYGQRYGRDAEDYARQTFSSWKSGARRMSGLVAKRLFSFLPKRMPLHLKYELAGNIWQHFGPSSSHAFVVGADTPIEVIADTVAKTLEGAVTAYSIPANVAARFAWLADGDVQIKEQLLNHFRRQEKALAVEKVRMELPVLQNQMRNHSGVTGLVRAVLQVQKHQISIRVAKGHSPTVEIDRSPQGAASSNSAFGKYWWLWLLVALGLFWLFRQ